METLPKAGERYCHFKGHLITVVDVFHDSEDPAKLWVGYLHGDDPAMARWVRPLTMWEEPVAWPDGVTRPRFVRRDAPPKLAAPSEGP